MQDKVDKVVVDVCLSSQPIISMGGARDRESSQLYRDRNTKMLSETCDSDYDCGNCRGRCGSG